MDIMYDTVVYNTWGGCTLLESQSGVDQLTEKRPYSKCQGI
jgi:hypothetical protein